MNNIQISTRHAVSRLNDTNMIQVLKEGEVPGLVPRFLPREDVVQMIANNVVEITGPEAQKKSFGMSLLDDGKAVFIQTREEA